MKKFFIAILVNLIIGSNYAAFSVPSNYEINTVADGTVLKCEGAKQKGILEEYKDQVIDYYTFRDGKIYSSNMVNTFRNGDGNARKVKKLKISDEKITFKERLYTAAASNYKWVTINRSDGRYSFNAKKKYNWAWYCRKAYVVGTCSIVK